MFPFMGARDAGAKEELRQVYGVSERTEGDGAANLIQKLRAINYALGELGQWCAYKVFHGVERGLRTKLEKTRKSIKGKKNKDKVAAELTHQLKIEHKAINLHLCVSFEKLFPRDDFHGGYNYYTRSMDFGAYVPLK